MSRKRSTKNKVHYTPKGSRTTVCGVMQGERSFEKAPVTREWRDVTCLNCKRVKPKRKGK